VKFLIGYLFGIASCVAPVYFLSEVTVSIDWSTLLDVGSVII